MKRVVNTISRKNIGFNTGWSITGVYSGIRGLSASPKPKKINSIKTIPSQPSSSVSDQIKKITFVSHPFSLTDIPIPESSDKVTEEIFAVVEFSGTQYKVTFDDVIVANSIEDIDIGMIISVGNVLMIGSKKGTIVGHPYIEGAKVTGEVEEITKDRKVIIFKQRRRKNSRRLRGYRRPVVTIRINNITLDHSLDEYVKRM